MRPTVLRACTSLPGRSEDATITVDVDIGIAVHNALHWVRPCFAALRAHTPEAHRLVVVDDASDAYVSAELEALLSDWPHEAIVMHNRINLGYLSSINRAIAAGDAPAVVVLNSDTLVTPGWLSGLVACLESDPEIGVASPLASHANFTRLEVPDGQSYLSVSEIVRRRSPSRYPDIGIASGFCMIARRDLYETVGLFDEVYGHGYYEEADFCLRAHEQGWRVVADDRTFIWHNGWTTFGRDERNHWMETNRRRFERRWGRAHAMWHERFLRDRPLQPVMDALASDRRVRGSARAQATPKLPQSPAVPAYERRDPEDWAALAAAVEHRNLVLTGAPRVLYVLPGIGPWGGVISVLQLVNRLLERGFDASAATCGNVVSGFDAQMFFRPWVFDRVEDMLDQLPEYDLVVATRWDTVYEALLLCERSHARLAYFVQDLEPAAFAEGTPEHDAGRRTYALAPDRIVKSTWLRDLLSPYGGCVHHIPLGLDRDTFYAGPQPAADVPRLVLSAARPGVAARNLKGTIEIMRRILGRRDDVLPVFFGKPFDMSLPKGEHMGILPAAGVASLLRRSRVLIDASLEQGFGRPGIEAMACGTNAVLTSRGGINEYASDGVNCLQCDPTDIDGFVEAVCRFLDDDDLAARCRTNGLRTAARFDVELEADRTAALFRSLLT